MLVGILSTAIDRAVLMVEWMAVARIVVVALVIVSWVTFMLLTYRLAQYRVDKQLSGNARPLVGWAAFLEESYREEARPLVGWLRASALGTTVSFLLAFGLLFF